MKLSPNLSTITGRELKEHLFDPDASVVSGSNFMVGNGYMGYRGTFMEAGKADYAACIVTNTYDNADGKWRELCNVPNGLYAAITANGIPQKVTEHTERYERQLDLARALFTRKTSTALGTIETEKFVSMAAIHGLAMRVCYTAHSDQTIEIVSGIDGDVWSINGEHFASMSVQNSQGVHQTVAVTQEDGIRICVACKTVIQGPSIITNQEADRHPKDSKKNDSVYKMDLKAGQAITFFKYAAVFTSNDDSNPDSASLNAVLEFEKEGYDALRHAHVTAWDALWETYFIEVEADLNTQVAVMFNLYHNIIHTPTHALLPIGARGLSCQAYQGAAFWDQEIYNLPMYLYTKPEVARNILKYRHATLDGARKKAKKLGFRGAFYAWISGDTGEELCPDFFFKDVLSGRKIRNHFNDWQIHISPDIGYTILKYMDVTGDLAFIKAYGYEVLADICLFLKSRTHFNPEHGHYEFIRLLGPDEYHENVDNDVFTNYQAKYVIERTLALMEQLESERPGLVSKIHADIGMTEEDLKVVKDMGDRLYVAQPSAETGVIEQFDGYFKLEHILPDALKADLKDPLEYWGWPNGVAVHTQVLKQADVVQLFVQHPNFDPAVLEANYNYYEPLTEHGSSLSPAMHAIVASWIGKLDEAERYFEKGCLIDLNNSNKAVSGGTFIGGIHTAAAGAVWQMIVFGFAHFRYVGGVVYMTPKILPKWQSYRFKLDIRGHHITCTVKPGVLQVQGKERELQTEFSVGSLVKTLVGDQTLMFELPL